MPRDDDQESASLAKTSRAMRALGHGASGGHNRGSGRSPVVNAIKARSRAPLWDHLDDDYQGEGDAVSYQFQEYPKHVTVGGKLFVCNSQGEEDQALATGEVVREDDERKRLVALASVKDVQVDGRWSIAKMTKAITDAGFDAGANPFE